jgi:hypothetical protein
MHGEGWLKAGVRRKKKTNKIKTKVSVNHADTIIGDSGFNREAGMAVSGVSGSNESARTRAAQDDSARVEANRRRVEAENQRAAQQQASQNSKGVDINA